MTTSRSKATVLATVCLLALGSRGATAAPIFTSGNLVLYRVGDGSTALTGNAAPVSIQEFSPTGASPVQTITLSSSGADSFTTDGNATSDGILQFSSDNRYLMFTG